MGQPTFICIGPGRTGTSWLREMLDSHPDVSLSSIKETEYFNNNVDKGREWYESHFVDDSSKATGEISNMYYVDSELPQRIHADYPNLKIIACTRNPETLIKSFYQFGVRRGVAASSLESALEESNSKYMGTGYQHRSKTGKLTPGDQVSLLDSVRLEKWLQPYLDTFGSENVLLIPFEDLRSRGEGILSDVYSFLGVESSHKPEALNEVINPGLSPKNKHVALLAHKAAYTLRKLGFNSLLSGLHKSRLVKSLLFKEAKSVKSGETLDLPEHVVSSLKSENEKIKSLYETVSG